MPALASPAWVEELNRALGELRVPPSEEGSALPLVIQQVVTLADAEAEPATWYVTVSSDGVTACFGRTTDPDITFTQSLPVADAVHRGETSAREAFMLGQIRVGGDVRLLVREQALFTALAEASARAGEEP